tara:strand:- start:903 stop:1580 length:678 start_codon:yes stop_codon:yes gene_type:complete
MGDKMHAEHAPLWVKICGLVEPETAEAAAASGASAIGLNFYPPSKRSVSATQARMICEQAALGNGCLKIGLFVNASMAEVHTVLATVPLDALQFHGDESSEYCRQFDLPVIKVIGVDTQTNVTQRMRAYPNIWSFLLDKHDAQQYGGTGKSFAWSQWPTKASQPLILAGGLNPTNVRGAVAQLEPFGVDASSGVEVAAENERGFVKDPQLIEQFIQEARRGRSER